MEVAVAGMKDIADTQTGGRGHAADLFENNRKLGAWDHAILHDVARRKAPGSGEGRFAAFPDEEALLLASGKTIFPCAIRLTKFADPRHLKIDLGGRAVDLDQKQRFALRVAGMDGGFGRLNRQAVHNLHGRGKNAGSDDVGNALTGSGDRIEGREQDLRRPRAA